MGKARVKDNVVGSRGMAAVYINATEGVLFLFLGLYVFFLRDYWGLPFMPRTKGETAFVVIAFAIGSLGLSVHGFYRAYRVAMKIMNAETPEAITSSDYFMCTECLEPLAGAKLEYLECPHCGKALEPLRGFYERHPELVERSEESVQQSPTPDANVRR